MRGAARRGAQLSSPHVSQSIVIPSCLPPSANSWGFNLSLFEREARLVRVLYVLSLSPSLIVVVALLDRSFFSLTPPYVHVCPVFSFCSFSPRHVPVPAYVSSADSLVGSAPVRLLACCLSSLISGRQRQSLFVFPFLVSKFRDRTTILSTQPLSFGFRHSLFPFLSFPASLFLPSLTLPVQIRLSFNYADNDGMIDRHG
jgi:hypothetical protein